MSAAKGQLHIVFGPTAQEALVDAMRLVGREERVVSYPDDLSIGPINGESAESRVASLLREFGPAFGYLRELPAELRAFWREFRSAEALPVFWFTRRSAREFSGFLELALSLGDQPFRVIDFTGTDVIRRRHDAPGKLSVYLSLGEMQPSEVAAYIGSDAAVSSSERERYRQTWEALRNENAPLRVLADGGLASAPASFFDVALLMATPRTWQGIFVTIGEVWGRSFDDNVFQASEPVLAGRIRTLVSLGLLECRGDVDDIRAAEIRRSSRPASVI